ncbi:hypothetical protein BDZ97DRAFT_2070738 [Flammula alnicola]|nr:hypothetical protein BDZ97DRAFT_2070738 [Flammula alnicola]
MLPAPLSYQDVRDYLRGATAPPPDAHINSSLEYHQDRLQYLTSVIDSAANSEAGKGRLLARWGLRSRAKKKALSVEELRESQGDSKAAIMALHSLLSPIQRLPPEILTEVFIHCLPRAQFVEPNGTDAPLLLMQVCTGWWRICVSSPQLWSSLDIFPKNPKPAECDEDVLISNRALLLNVWIPRSGDLPLSLSMGDNLSTAAIRFALGNCAPRLQHLKFVALTKTCASLLPDKTYPLLDSFELYTPKGLTDALINDLSRAMMRAPILRQFIWESDLHRFRPSHVELHWSNLTYLRLNATITLEQCLTILSMATKATHLDFQDILVFSRAIPHNPLEIALPELSSFVICSRYDVSEVFDRITLPRLKELNLTLRSWPHSSIMGFSRRSRFPLQHLNIFFPHVTEPDIIECLETVQNTLTELTIQGEGQTTVTDILLDRLTYTGAQDVFCPKLETMALYRCISCSPGRFARMAESRLRFPGTLEPSRPRVEPLKVIQVYNSEVELSWLKPLRSLGLTLMVYSEDDCSMIVDIGPEAADEA